MHCRTFYRQRRGDRTLAEAAEATGINEGTLSRIERGEQFPKAEQVTAILAFYDEAVLQAAYRSGVDLREKRLLCLLYPASVLRCIQLERNCVDCGKPLPPESRANRKRHAKGECV
jgi:transcriptional regulator with XRE-family HTH domain